MDTITRLEQQPWYQGNELKETQDALMQATHIYGEACREYGADPTPENLAIAVEAGRKAERLAADYDRLTGLISDTIPFE